MSTEPGSSPSPILPALGILGLAAIFGAFALLFVGPKETRVPADQSTPTASLQTQPVPDQPMEPGQPDPVMPGQPSGEPATQPAEPAPPPQPSAS